MSIITPRATIEYKDIPGGSMHATNDTQGVIEGYLNKTEIVDGGYDRSRRGCFQQTIKDAYARKAAQDLDFLWPFLLSHQAEKIPPGGIFSADETPKGLYIKTQLNLEIQSGRELYSSFKMGTMKKLSMGYRTVRSDYEQFEGKTIRNLLEVDVMEGSAVNFAMNDESLVTAVKGRKDYSSDYLQAQQQDWLSDLNMLWYPFQAALIETFADGVAPTPDGMQAMLDQFRSAVLAYVQAGVDLDMGDYLQQVNSSESLYMTASDNPLLQRKAGRTISGANLNRLAQAVQHFQTGLGHLRAVVKIAAPNPRIGPPAPKPGSGPSDAERRQRIRDLTGYPNIASAPAAIDESKLDLSSLDLDKLGKEMSQLPISQVDGLLDDLRRENNRLALKNTGDELTGADKLRLERMNNGL